MGALVKTAYRRRATRPTLTFGSANSGPGVPALKVYVNGIERAFLTYGCHTVTSTNPELPRTLTEHKKVGLAYRDDFDRTRDTPTVAGLGVSPYFGSWSRTSGGVITDDTVSGGTAKTHVAVASSSYYRTLRDAFQGEDTVVRTRITTSPSGGSASFSLLGGYVLTGEHDRARCTYNTSGALTATLAKVTTDPGTGEATETIMSQDFNVITGYTGGDWIRLRRRRIGNTTAFYMWRDTDPVPSTPTITAVDSTHMVGRVGYRAFNGAGNTNQTYETDWFDILAGDWVSPPAISHSTFVRFLPQPFTEWNDSVEVLVRRWLTDTSPDLLAYWMMFTQGGAIVTDPALFSEEPSGIVKQILGEAGYGPNDVDGRRKEGADWNDYIRLAAPYPGLHVPTTDQPEVAEQYRLDCSGTTRMVAGHLMGLPMCLSDEDDFDGLRLPRRATDIIRSGLGRLIAHSVNVPVDRTYMRIGDHIGFNADPSDDPGNGDDGSGQPEEIDDHIGPHAGVDQFGNEIFFSSRKTSNGPGFGYIGGPAQLNGTGFWARAARDVRRF